MKKEHKEIALTLGFWAIVIGIWYQSNAIPEPTKPSVNALHIAGNTGDVALVREHDWVTNVSLEATEYLERAEGFSYQPCSLDQGVALEVVGRAKADAGEPNKKIYKVYSSRAAPASCDDGSYIVLADLDIVFDNYRTYEAYDREDPVPVIGQSYTRAFGGFIYWNGDQSCVLDQGSEVTVIDITANNHVIVEYESKKDVGFGTRCPSTNYWKLSKGAFSTFRRSEGFIDAASEEMLRYATALQNVN